MKKLLPASFLTITLLVAAATRTASAACVGGSLLKGSFSVTIYGNLVSGGTNGLSGVITSNGKCSITGTIGGNINNTSVQPSAVTGSYSVNSNLSGSMTLAVAGEATRTFAINLASKDKEVLGLETDGSASDLLDARAQVAKTFSLASLSGAYSLLCYAPGSQYQNGTDVFDGAGNWTDTTLYYSSPGVASQSGGTGTYTVGTDGSVIFTLNSGGNIFVSYGSIDTKNANVQSAFVSLNGAGTGNGPELCVDKKQ